ncbi:MAG: FkbM family methyltransferase [Verrucomicrobiota bacterium]|nr:FkbM family methyltransferase [Verrucomicrobiota bacterium]
MLPRYLWRAFKARFRDQAAELSVIKDYVQPGDIVCDIGANKGSYLFWLSRWVHKGKVVAFEPQAHLAQYLKKVCSATGLRNVTVEAAAVHAKSGSMNLYIPAGCADSPGASLGTRITSREDCRAVSVPVVALDDYFETGKRISVLKIDVEGAELGVFKGAERILKEQAPLLVFECENRHLESTCVTDVFNYLATLGYEGEFVCGRHLRPLSEFDASVHQKENGARFWDAKDYYNNFVFRKPKNK